MLTPMSYKCRAKLPITVLQSTLNDKETRETNITEQWQLVQKSHSKIMLMLGLFS